jgi:hypothetical protein
VTSKRKVKISSALRNVAAIAASAVILTIVWPHLPRSTELAQGCTVTTTGTIASIYGNLYAAVVKLGASAVFFAAATAVIMAVGYLGTSTSALATRFRERRAAAAKRKQEEAEYAASVKDVKACAVTYTEIDKYVRGPGPVVLTTKYDNAMSNKEPSLALKLFGDFYRTVTSSTSEARFSITLVTCIASFFLHAFYIRHHVCAETNSQILGVWVAGVTLTAAAAFLLQWMYLSTWPVEETTAALNKVFGSVDVAQNGRPSEIMKLPVVRIPDIEKGTLYKMFEHNITCGESYYTTVSRTKSGSWCVNYSANETVEYGERQGSLYVRATRRCAYRITYDGYKLVAGPLTTRRSGKDLEFAAGVVIVVPRYATIREFFDVVARVSADIVKDDKPAHDFIERLNTRNNELREQLRIKSAQTDKPTEIVAALPNKKATKTHKHRRSK